LYLIRCYATVIGDNSQEFDKPHRIERLGERDLSVFNCEGFAAEFQPHAPQPVEQVSQEVSVG